MNPLYDPAELKVRLQHERFTTDSASKILDELQSVGVAARPLIPALATRLAAGTFPYTISAVIDVFVATGHPDLLGFIRSPAFWSSLNISDRARLLSAGVTDLEPDLLDYLWAHFSDAGDYNRCLIVQSLAVAGSAAALDILRLIDSRLSGEVAERSADAEESQSLLSAAELSSQASFSQVVRDAYQAIQNRNG